MCDTGRAPGRRPKVFRITAGYAVASFVVIQVADIIVPALDLSQHVVLWIVIALIAGLPIALALRWRYDLSPEGLKFTGTVEDENADTGMTGGNSLRGQPAAVAVLRFDNLTPNTPHAYLADATPIPTRTISSASSDGR